MSTKLITVGLDDRLTTVKNIFENQDIHHILVVEANELFGIVSDFDLYKALSPNIGMRSETLKDAATINKQVHQIMSRNPITLGPDATIRDAVNIFCDHSFTCIPIVSHEKKPLGIVTVRDIMRALKDMKK